MMTNKPILKAPVTPEDQLYYQGVGYLFALVKSKLVKGAKYKFMQFHVVVDGVEHLLTFKSNLVKTAIIQQLKAHPETPLWLRCYPQYSQTIKNHYFCCIYFSLTRPEDASDRQFLLKGIWQYIAPFKGNYFTIYRNQRKQDEFIRHHHVPIVWSKRAWKPTDKLPKFSVINAYFGDGQMLHLQTISESENIPVKVRKGKKTKTALKPVLPPASLPPHQPKVLKESPSQCSM